MTRRSRRRILCGAAGLVALSAGCLDETGGTDDDSSGSDESNGTGDDTDDDEPGSGETDGDEDGNRTALEEFEDVEHVSFSHTDVPTDPDAALFTSGGRATDWLEERDLEDGSLTEFVDVTDFEASVVVTLEADAPNLCYEMVLEKATVEDDSLELEAAIRDDSEDNMGCAQQETTVGHLVRAPISGSPNASVTLMDRDGEPYSTGLAADSAGESDSDGDDSSDSDDE